MSKALIASALFLLVYFEEHSNKKCISFRIVNYHYIIFNYHAPRTTSSTKYGDLMEK